jgi:hypothetical protein
VWPNSTQDPGGPANRQRMLTWPMHASHFVTGERLIIWRTACALLLIGALIAVADAAVGRQQANVPASTATHSQ